MNKKIIIAVLIVLAAGSFYAGMKYDQGKVAADRRTRVQQFGGNFNTAGLAGSGRGARSAGGFASGSILSKDAESITVKLADGGSKIVFLSGSVQITKSAAGSPNDLVVGEQVTVTGIANSDGSISAQSIQIRPELPQR